MASIYEYFMWQDFSNNVDDHLLENPSIPNDTQMFDIHLHLYHLLQLSYPINDLIPLTTTHMSHPLPRSTISSSDDESRAAIIDSVLSSTGAASDFIHSVSPQISAFAFNMVNHPCNANANVLTMGLIISVVSPYDDRHQEIDRALSEILVQENSRFKPASKSCIQRLKRVRVQEEEEDSMKDCCICLEKQLVGEEVIGLPCEHYFHGDCIVSWLESSHLCPLCRFSMP